MNLQDIMKKIYASEPRLQRIERFAAHAKAELKGESNHVFADFDWLIAKLRMAEEALTEIRDKCLEARGKAETPGLTDYLVGFAAGRASRAIEELMRD